MAKQYSLSEIDRKRLQNMLRWHERHKGDKPIQRRRGTKYPVSSNKIQYGKPTSQFTSGATIELDPCDIHGLDNGEADKTVYCRADQLTVTMTNSTSIATSYILPFMQDSVGDYYLLGHPVEVVTDVDVSGTTLVKKTRIVWVMSYGSQSADVTWHTGTTCP